jgi:Protein of unknown function (DUF2971)
VRVYHFINEQHGLDDIRKRRIKIATFQELNDPFELISIDFSNEYVRKAFTNLKLKLSENRGVVCFSREWSNPVLWSHYADKHRGICLGFDVPENTDKLHGISYSRMRVIAEIDKLVPPISESNLTYMKQLLYTKYSHWKYENEVRAFTTLEEKDPKTGFYFANFSEELLLKEVIVGACSNTSRETLNQALGNIASEVNIIKARLAFKTFKVVRQKDKKLWS